jgi:sulfate adenylyltransferase
MEVIRLRGAAELNPPYGGTLVDACVDAKRVLELKALARDLASIDLTPRQLCELEQLATGAYSPLSGFLSQRDYLSVLQCLRLADGRLWPLPVVLDVPPETAAAFQPGQHIALRDGEGTMLAVLTLAEMWPRALADEALRLYGSTDLQHPEVRELLTSPRTVCLSGKLDVVELPLHQDFTPWRATPAQLRQAFLREGTRRVLAYSTDRLLHRSHLEFAHRMAQLHGARLLLLGCVGRAQYGEPMHYSLARAWHAALAHHAEQGARLNLIELAPCLSFERQALLHAIVARNHGCTHVVAEHDYVVGRGGQVEPRYGEFRALETLQRHAPELGVQVIGHRELVYEEDHPEHFLAGRPLPGHVSELTGAELHAEGPGSRGVEVARWFSYPEVLHEWQRSYRLRSAQGFTVFFTGLSGAGKSTLAQLLYTRLMESGERAVTLLDGDIVRKHLSAGLGFSREHRDLNVTRLGFVSSLITRHGGVVICAPIAPYAATRAQVRAMIEPHGGFIEIHVATTLAVCEARDRKGLYARARAGLIKEFTGISDPYEPPAHPELAIDTSQSTPEQAIETILHYLVTQGYLSQPESVAGPAPAQDPDTLWTRLAATTENAATERRPGRGV